jgi:hypothetical protein
MLLWCLSQMFLTCPRLLSTSLIMVAKVSCFQIVWRESHFWLVSRYLAKGECCPQVLELELIFGDRHPARRPEVP